jgi:hypothetical protein
MSLSTQPAPFNLAEQLLKSGMKLGGPAHDLFLKFLNHTPQHSLVALYAFKPIPSLGVYDDMDRLMHDVWVLNAQGCEGVYVTLNPISKENPPLAWVESPNQLIVNPKKGLGPRDEHILRRQWIFIDLDRKVKTGNASKEEKALLYQKLMDVLRWATFSGIPAAKHFMTADSGNGYHALLAVDLPNDEASRSLVRRLLEALSLKFDDAVCEIDQAVHNAQRITKAYGTTARKFPQTEGRPWWRSRLIPPDPLFRGAATAEMIESAIASIAMTSAVAARLPVTTSSPNSKLGVATPADLDAYLKVRGIKLQGPLDSPGVWVGISNAPCKSKHSTNIDGGSCVGIQDGFCKHKCAHSSCTHLDWYAFRQMLDAGQPPYYFPWESEVEEAQAAVPLLPYPTEVWDGTLYGEFAALCGKGNFIPKEFFIESVKTAVGSIAGNRVRGLKKGMNLRQNTVLIGLIGKGKGTAVRAAQDPFTQDLNENLLTHAAGNYKNIGAMLDNSASAPALFRALKANPRVLLTPSEFDALLSNTNIEGSGASLLSTLREFFDSEWVTPSTTNKRKQADVSGHGLVSLLTSTQPETLDKLIAIGGKVGTGFLSRTTLVLNREARTVAAIDEPDLTEWTAAMKARLLELEDNPVVCGFTPQAETLLHEWWKASQTEAQARTENVEVITRLNILVLRNALHMAWLDKTVIDEKIMARAIKLGDWQLSMRQSLVLSEADNPYAAHEIKIAASLRRSGAVTGRELMRNVSSSRVGTRIHQQCLDGLFKNGTITKAPTNRKGTFKYGLTKHKPE